MSSHKNLLHCIIMIAITFGIGLLPPLGGDITPLGMKVLGVFIGVLYGWSFLSFFWTSCFGMLALALTGYDTIDKILAAGFSNTMVLQMICIFTLVVYFIDNGLVEVAVGFFVNRKITHGRPFVLMFMLFFASALAMMLGLGFASVLFCWAIMYKLFDSLGYKKGNLLVTYMIFGAVMSANVATSVFPFNPFPIMMSGFTAAVGHTISFVPWIGWTFCYVVVLYIIYTLVGKYILRLDVKAFFEKAEEIKRIYIVKTMTKQQKFALAMLCLFLLICLIPFFLPEGTIKAFLGQFGLIGSTFLIMTITSIIRIDEKPITNWVDNAKKGIDWNMIIMFVATTPIANALESADAGILSTVFSHVLPVLSKMPGDMFIWAVVIFMIIVTQFVHNIVLMVALSPTLFSLAASMGNVNLSLLAACIIISATAAFLTPGASATSAAAFANVEYVETKQVYKIALCVILSVIIALAIMYPVAKFVF